MFLSGSVALRTAHMEAADTTAYTASIIGKDRRGNKSDVSPRGVPGRNVGGAMFRILSLDGGGIKGAFSAWVLTTLEEDTGRKVPHNAVSERHGGREICTGARCQCVKAS